MKRCRIARKMEGPLEVGGHKFKVRPVNMIVFFICCIQFAASVQARGR